MSCVRRTGQRTRRTIMWPGVGTQREERRRKRREKRKRTSRILEPERRGRAGDAQRMDETANERGRPRGAALSVLDAERKKVHLVARVLGSS